MLLKLLLCLAAIQYTVQGQCSYVNFVSRSEWGARCPTRRSSLDTPVSMVFIHHTAGSRCYSQSSCSGLVRRIQNYHMDTRHWNDIGYSFMVGNDGRVYEGRGWTTMAAHAKGYNSVSYGIVFLGNYMDVTPSQAALNAAQALIQCGVEKGYITRQHEVFGHRDGGWTLCPGDQLYTLIRSWPNYSNRQIQKH